MPTYSCSVCGTIINIHWKEWKLLDPSADLFCSRSCLLEGIQSNSIKSWCGYPTEDRQGTLWSKALRCFFYSKFEEQIAKFFVREGIEYQYEKYWFPVGTTIYIPDFFLPQYLCFVEVKGLYGVGSKNKLKKFREENTNVKLFTIPWTMRRFFKC